MTIALETIGLSRAYRQTTALQDVNIRIPANTITGLLGRNGAGKTTLMALATAQDRPTAGKVLVHGEEPFERTSALNKMCFIRDNQRYPDDYEPHHALKVARMFFSNWSEELASELMDMFRIPNRTVIKKLSRGQLSSLGIVIGLASRAEVTFFDEPYLGLDATARAMFYDVLLREFQERPRTIVLSTHLIDEMDRLFERIIILGRGRVVRDDDVDNLRGSVQEVAGRIEDIQRFSVGRRTLMQRTVGSLGTAMFAETLTEIERAEAVSMGLEVRSASLQDIVAAFGLSDTAHAEIGA